MAERKEEGVSKTATMDFQRTDFGLFRTLVERVSWEGGLKGKESRKKKDGTWELLSRKKFPCAVRQTSSEDNWPG